MYKDAYYHTKEQAQQAFQKRRNKYGHRISRFVELDVAKDTIYKDTPRETEVYRIVAKQNGAAVMMILSDVTADKQHTYGQQKLDDYDKRGVGEYRLYGSVPDMGFYVAPKYHIARRNFLHSGADTQAAGEIVNLGGMNDTHTPASYWIIANDSKGLITKKKK